MSNLNENIHEESFSVLMTILMCQNNPLFDLIALSDPYYEFRGHKFDLRKLSECWINHCRQNIKKYPSEAL